jgi:hypothetical protein
LFFSLHEYLLRRLEKQQDEFAINIYETIYGRCSEIFLHLNESHYGQDRIEYDLFKFKQIFLDEKINKIINVAIENKCSSFLKKIRVFEDLFVIRNLENNNYYDYWDNKVKEIFRENKYIVQQKNKYLLENHYYFSHINQEYKIFLKSGLYSYNITEYKCYGEIINHVINELEAIYDFAISINRRFIDSDFELLWNECFEAIEKEDHKTFHLFFSFFTFLLDKIFEREYKKPNPDNGMIYSLFSRVLQIKEFGNKIFIDIIIEKYTKLIEKHPKLIEIEKIKPSFGLIEKIDYTKRYDI